MARWITVYKPEDLEFVRHSPNSDVNSKEFELWCEECRKKTIFDCDLASESGTLENWSGPASEIGLPLLSEIHEKGFHEGIEWRKDKIIRAIEELHKWRQYMVEKNSMHKQLEEDYKNFLEGLYIALKVDGLVSII